MKNKPTCSLKRNKKKKKKEKQTLERLHVKYSPENEREFLFSVSFALQLEKTEGGRTLNKQCPDKEKKFRSLVER